MPNELTKIEEMLIFFTKYFVDWEKSSNFARWIENYAFSIANQAFLLINLGG